MEEEQLIRKVAPNNVEAEKSVIGAMLMDSDAIMTVSEIVKADDFYQKQYGAIYEGILELYNTGVPVDVLTLQEHLKAKGVPEEMYSVEVLGALLNAVPTSANVKYYATIVHEKAVLRKLISTTEKITERCYLDKENIEDILEATEKNVFELVQERSSGDYVDIKDVSNGIFGKNRCSS